MRLRNVVVISFLMTFLLPSATFACGYQTFSQPSKTVKVSELSQAIIIWQEGTEHLIIDPGLTGNAPDFGLVLAFPSRPEISEAPRKMFDELEEYTLPAQRSLDEFDGFSGITVGAAAVRPSVTVVEKKKVGDFDATVLTANNTDALIKWLQKNKYQFGKSDRENFEYYISRGGYYFVALKISVSGFYLKKRTGDYELRPVEFVFQTPQPIFPLRLARDDDQISKLRIYAISKKAIIVPGAGISYSGFDYSAYGGALSSLEKFLNQGAWLTKNDIFIDPSQIEHDLALIEWEKPENFRSGYEGAIYTPPLLAEPQKRDAFAGVVEKSPSELVFPARKLSAIKVELPWYEQIIQTIVQNPYLRSAAYYLGTLVLIHFYIAAALFALARRLNIRARFRAWFPLTNLSLLVSAAGKPQNWFWAFFYIPAVLAFGTALVVGIQDVISDIFDVYPSQIQLIYPLSYTLYVIVTLIMLLRLCRSLVRRCGRPSWWGPLMILVPPVGLVLIGVLAWGPTKN